MISHQYSRKLDDSDLVEHFLEVVLKYEGKIDTKLLRSIVMGEADLKNYDANRPTLSSTANRDRKYKNPRERWELRKIIVEELRSKMREDDDEDIELGIGGALPNVKVKTEKKAIIVIGLPASGKSAIADKIADECGAIILDSDFAKRKLPEFRENPAGASLVHDESSQLIFGFNGKDKPDHFQSLIEICSQNNTNIVIPKIGYDFRSINNFAKQLKEAFEYEQVHLVHVSLDRRKATLRAVNRFLDTNRYVPLSLIFDGYSEDPVLTFYRLKECMYIDKVYFDSFGKLSTDVPKGTQPEILYADDISPVNIFK